MRMRSIGTNRAASVSVRQNPGISNWTSSRRGARRALNTDDDETMIIIGGFKQKSWMSTGDKDDWGTWTRRRTRMLTKMRPSSSPSRPSPPTPSSSPSSDLSLWSVDNDKEEEEDGDENAKGGHQVDTWTDSRNVK